MSLDTILIVILCVLAASLARKYFTLRCTLAGVLYYYEQKYGDELDAEALKQLQILAAKEAGKNLARKH